MKYRLKNTEITIKIISIYQIIGGVLGLGITAWLLLRTGQINGAILLIFLISVGLYIFSIQSGSLLLSKDRRKKGLIFSIIHHAIQIVAISVGSYKYEYYSGIKGTVGIEFTKGFEFDFGIGLSEFNFRINSASDEIFLYVNVFAIIVISILVDIYRELYAEVKEPAELDSDFIDDN